MIGTGKYGFMFLPKKRDTTPLASGYRPECDDSRELDDEEQNYYQSFIGVLRWLAVLNLLLKSVTTCNLLVSKVLLHIE